MSEIDRLVVEFHPTNFIVFLKEARIKPYGDDKTPNINMSLDEFVKLVVGMDERLKKIEKNQFLGGLLS